MPPQWLVMQSHQPIETRRLIEPGFGLGSTATLHRPDPDAPHMPLCGAGAAVEEWDPDGEDGEPLAIRQGQAAGCEECIRELDERRRQERKRVQPDGGISVQGAGGVGSPVRAVTSFAGGHIVVSDGRVELSTAAAIGGAGVFVLVGVGVGYILRS